MNGIVSMITGSGDKAAKRAAAEARAQQEKALAAQEAATLRAQQSEDKRAEDLSGQLAAQRRAVNARRSGRGALGYNGPVTTMKETLGG